ncbi:MAG: 1-acyl-sn-glycerol-3-phosphate acyltransferase [Naasia sp.]|uniref:lysophospholipid acyltransferase family protein n=1 Tax=Naasia sp. TaxID=2546198 RepID=UPI00260D798B|nr:lysophospholipid acyltransferase family protein [Naasia sp.]MCU1571823.1 1-acyl-sn-glycerol-3-phosphate acyltransferase [Naasia sp.]
MRRKPEKTRPSAFWPVIALVLPPFRLVTRLRILDGEKVPETGAFVLAPNHYSEIDPIVMGWAAWHIGRAPHFFTKSSLFKIPLVGAVLRSTGQLPVERAGGTGSRASLEAAAKVVAAGGCVVVYPEGSLTRDPDLWPMRGKSGAVRVALEHGIPVIPAAHWGTQNLLARYGKKLRVFPRAKITVRFGDPVDLSRFQGRPIDASVLAEATEAVMDDITVLLEGLRGEKAPAVRWDPRKSGQTETGRFD